MPTPEAAPIETRIPRWGYGAAWGVVIVLAILHLLYYAPRTVDDMFIFLRYAENLAAGEGLVYNPGERVEGFSSPLWVLLVSVGAFFGANLITWTKLLALMAFGALMAGVHRAGREVLDLGRWAALAPCLFLSLNSYVVSWTLWGLETPAYLALLVWVMVLARRVCLGPCRRSRVALVIAGTGLVLARPEAPLFLALIGVATVVEPLRWSEIKARALRGLSTAALVIGAYGAYLVFRRTYYGLWFPHTHYAKQGHGFDLDGLASLYAQGSPVWETGFVLVGFVAAVYLVIRRRAAAPLAILVGSCFFVSVVVLDWMPNVRHFLPIWIVLPLTATAGAQALFDSAVRWRKPMLAALTLLGLGTGVSIAAVDARYSPMDFLTHGQGVQWVRYKGPSAVASTWACLRREAPAHVEAMDPYNHGMITQLYRLLESDERPLRDTWYVGRDIGRVGWLAPVRVFDTEGLFTPDVVASEHWQETRAPDDALVERTFARDVVMTELMVGWVTEAWRTRSVRERYRQAPTAQGSNHLMPRERRAPTPQTVLRRYREALSKLPTSYHLMTLYGEGVGAAIERRAQVAETTLDEPIVSILPPDLVRRGGVTLDAQVEALGCLVSPARVSPGEELHLECYFRALQRVRRDYMVFVHLEGEEGSIPFNGDHAPVGGFWPTTEWEPGTIMRDAHSFRAPAQQTGRVSVRYGLFLRSHRASAASSSAVDNVGRIIGPSFTVEE